MRPLRAARETAKSGRSSRCIACRVTRQPARNLLKAEVAAPAFAWVYPEHRDITVQLRSTSQGNFRRPATPAVDGRLRRPRCRPAGFGTAGPFDPTPHEHDIARYLRRIIVRREGTIELRNRRTTAIPHKPGVPYGFEHDP
jgi:hypothetical protein